MDETRRRYAGRGLQTKRKDKDLMSDGGGTSKGRQRAPKVKPPRDDCRNRYKDKELNKETKDKDRTQDSKDSGRHESVRKVIREQVKKLKKAGGAEQAVERLMRAYLPSTRFRNKVYSVGGYVRDQLLGVPSKDIDMVVDEEGGSKTFAHQIHKDFPDSTNKPWQMGAYPIWAIKFLEDVEFKGKLYKVGGADIEIAEPQKETFPDENSRQRITESGTLKEDVERRDFTVNSLLRDLTTGEIRDLTGTSEADVKKGILRGNPGVDFADIVKADPLRMMRLIRFQAKYGWDVPLSVIRDVKRNAPRIQIVSQERIRAELEKVMKLGKLEKAIRFMKATGLLKYVLPEIDAMRGVEHDKVRGVHLEGDVYKHTLLVLRSAQPGIKNQMAALLHDVGKPATQELVGDLIRYKGHEDVGGDIAEAIMRRMKFDRTTTMTVRKMVENHMRPHHLADSKEKALRKFVRDVGEELVDAVLDLAEADSLGTLPSVNEIPELRKRIDEAKKIPVEVKLPINGNEIKEVLGVKAGPEVGKAVSFLKEIQEDMLLEGQEMSKEDAVNFLVTEYKGKTALDYNDNEEEENQGDIKMAAKEEGVIDTPLEMIDQALDTMIASIMIIDKNLSKVNADSVPQQAAVDTIRELLDEAISPYVADAAKAMEVF